MRCMMTHIQRRIPIEQTNNESQVDMPFDAYVPISGGVPSTVLRSEVGPKLCLLTGRCVVPLASSLLLLVADGPRSSAHFEQNSTANTHTPLLPR